MRRKKVKIPIYFGDLVIYEVDDWEKLELKYRKGFTKGYRAYVWRQEWTNGTVTYYVAFLKGEDDLSIIAHEAVHLVNQIFIDGKISLDPYNDEPQAYLTGWFVKQVTKFLNI